MVWMVDDEARQKTDTVVFTVREFSCIRKREFAIPLQKIGFFGMPQRFVQIATGLKALAMTGRIPHPAIMDEKTGLGKAATFVQIATGLPALAMTRGLRHYGLCNAGSEAAPRAMTFGPGTE